MVKINNLPFLSTVYIFFSCVQQTLADGQELSVSVSQCKGDTGIFSIDSLYMACDSYCTWGSDATFTGSYTIGDTLSTDSPIITAKIWGTAAFNDTVDICDNGKVYNDNGEYCPDAGTYAFETTTEVPGSPNSWYSSFASWLSFTVYATFDFGDAVVTCDIKIEGQNYAANSSYIMSASALMLAGAVFGLRLKKRRRLVTANEEGGHEEPATHFVEMTSP